MGNTILTGLRANGQLHLGNFLGAVLPMAKAQKNLAPDDKLYIFVPDLHSYTTPVDHASLYPNTLSNIKTYIAGGLSPDRTSSFVWRQSDVSAHAELAWTLSCFTYFGEAGRMTQFKEKKVGLEEKGDPVTVGLFNYPILMAADILAYGVDYVPVGDDQKQHLELARDLATRINNKFVEQFPKGVLIVPKPWKEQLAFSSLDEGIRIRSLSHPEKKMSKSVNDPKGTIEMTEDPINAAKKIMSATTDSLQSVAWDWTNQPGITNLLQILYLVSGVAKDEVIAQWTGTERYGDLKKAVAQAVESFLSDFQARRNTITDEQVEQVLQVGAQKANTKAQQTLHRVYKAVGLRK